MSGVRMLHFLKDLWKFIQIHQYYTMALSHSHTTNRCRIYKPLPTDAHQMTFVMVCNIHDDAHPEVRES